MYTTAARRTLTILYTPGQALDEKQTACRKGISTAVKSQFVDLRDEVGELPL